jgi:flagellar hook-associated protein 3 FlgL
MRITESYMWQQVTGSVGDARTQVAEAGQVMQTGIRVDRPSEDLAGWGQGERAAVRKSMSEQRGNAIAAARDGLSQADGALANVSNSLTRLNELTVQAANGTLSASDRNELVYEVQQLRDVTLAAANEKGLDGTYLLGGSRGNAPPFSQAGAWQGDNVTRAIETSETTSSSVAVSGQGLTAANGVDVFGLFSTITTALGANDQTGLQQALPSVQQAIAQVASMRTEVGSRIAALDGADGARQSFELTLTQNHARAVEADPVVAASNLTAAGNALNAARAAAQQILSLLQNG